MDKFVLQPNTYQIKLTFMVFFKSMIFKLIKFLDSKIDYEFWINLNLKIHHGLIQGQIWEMSTSLDSWRGGQHEENLVDSKSKISWGHSWVQGVSGIGRCATHYQQPSFCKDK
jgi:hypothetical protein